MMLNLKSIEAELRCSNIEALPMKTLPTDAIISPPIPPILMLTEQHVKEAIQEWCWQRGHNVAISGITWEYDPDYILNGAAVKLPLFN